MRSSYASLREDYPGLGSFNEEVGALADRAGSLVGNRLVNLPLRTAELLFDMLTVYAIATLMVMRQERMLASILRVVHPDHRRRTRFVILKIWVRLGAYVRAKVLVMTVIGVLMYLSLIALGVPFAVPLAIIVAFGEVIPAIGPWIGRVPLLAVAATQGWEILALTFLASFILENLKAYVISPHIEGQQMDIDPLLVLVSVIVGAALMGAPGRSSPCPSLPRCRCYGTGGRALADVPVPARHRRQLPAARPRLRLAPADQRRRAEAVQHLGVRRSSRRPAARTRSARSACGWM